MIDYAETLKAFSDNNYIPSKPEIISRIYNLQQESDNYVVDLADLVATDVGVSAEILKTLNSSYFGLRQPVSDIRQAVMLLGARMVSSLVRSHELKKSFSKKSSIKLGRFWDSAEAISAASVAIVRELDLAIPVEDVYALGLFQDCGIPVLAARYDNYADILREANLDVTTAMTEVEDRYLGINHAVVGAFVAEEWGLPGNICQTVLHSHQPESWLPDVKDTQSLLYAALKLSDNIVEVYQRKLEANDWGRHKATVKSILGLDDIAHDELHQRITDIVWN